MAGWYLSQAFAPDTPGTQVFLAPGPEDRSLASGPSPWIAGRLVRVPGRYWHRILIAVDDRAPAEADILDRWSGSADPDDAGEQRPGAEEVAAVRRALRETTECLRAGELIADEELCSLGPYTREDMAGMADAVMQVIDEAAIRDTPFSAWPE